jgi:hypothetical protein
MKRYVQIIILFLISIAFVACEKVFLGKDIENNPRSNFVWLWQKVEMGYSFFDVKDVEWDSVYVQYNPLIHDEMSDEELFDVLAQMLNELKDGHVNLISPFKTSKFEISSLGPENIDFRIIKDNYLGNDIVYTGPFTHGFLENEQVGYIRYSSFSNSITSAQLDYMLTRYQNTKGLIFDIRQNGGGFISNVFTLLSRFVTSETMIYSSQIKNGYKGDSPDTTFSDPVPVYVSPHNGMTYTKPVVVLTDRGTYSAGSFFAVSCLALPHITLMGDTTGGGLGLPNGGQLPNGWTYRFSVTRTIAVDGNNYENGVPPFMHVTLFADHNITGIDNIIDDAIALIMSQ